MTVRFKSQSEYQKSFGVSRSRSVSPQRCTPLAGLRSDHMGISREPALQRRRRLGPGGLAQSCSSLLCPPDPQQSSTEPTPHAQRTVPPAASRSRSAHRKEASKPPAPPVTRAHPGSPAQPETPAGPRPSADPVPPAEPQSATRSRPVLEPEAAEKSEKRRSAKPDDQPQLSRPLTAAPGGQQASSNGVQHALRRRAGLRSGGHRSGSHRSEYHRQFSWKKPETAASPVLTAEKVLLSRSVPPFKKNPLSVETEYQRSFQGLVPPTGPRLRRHLEHHRVPLFHAHMANRKKKEESQNKPHPELNVSTPQEEETTPPRPPQVQRGHRMLTEYESSFRSPLYRIPEGGGATDGGAPQAKELRQKAWLYRQRAWGGHFSRDHLSQLLSEHNALWEPTDSTTDPPTPRLTADLCQDADSRTSSRVEPLDLGSCSGNSSKKSSVVGSREINHTNKKTQTTPSPPAGRRTAWGQEEEEEEEEEDTDDEDGRLPTPRLKMLPVQRTHHDLTTPATGGAILVGALKSSDEASAYKQQRCGSAVSMAAGAEAAVDMPVKQKEAWPENNPAHLSSSGPSPNPKPAGSPPSKPIRMKQTAPSPVAPPPPVPPPQHCIQGTLRHPDFQHNGQLGLRFRDLPCPGGGCGSDDDDRLSVMSWRSAVSCSMASSVLERAQKRRENFWGKR